MKDDSFNLSRRKILGITGSIGAAGALGGAATTSLFWDEEVFGNTTDPNLLQAGSLDLKVDWEGIYWNGRDNPTIVSDDPSDGLGSNDSDGLPDLVDQPGPIINLEDVKPGDVMELTLSAHIFGNPGFLGIHYEEHLDDDNGYTEPENKVNGHDPSDGHDGTPDDGDLDQHMQVLVWYDDGDNLIDELRSGVDDDDDGNLDPPMEDYMRGFATIQDASAEFGGEDKVIYAGTLAGLDPTDLVLDSRLSVSGKQATAFPDTACYQNSTTEYIGVMAWLPLDIAGVNDNIVQTDQLTFEFGFSAVQCRHNTGNNGGPGDGGDGPGVIGGGPDVTVDGDKAISWIAVCCGSDPGDLSQYIECVTLDGNGEVDAVGLSGIDTTVCDVYYKAGNQIFTAHQGTFEPAGDLSASNFCGATESDDEAIGTKMEGPDIVQLKSNESLPDCQS